MSDPLDPIFGDAKYSLQKDEFLQGKEELKAFMKQVRPVVQERLIEHMESNTNPVAGFEPLRLTPEEFSAGKMRLRMFAVNHPVHAAPSAMEKIVQFLTLICTPAMAGFLLLFSVAGVTYAAEGSVPGDFLFPVKINVNERVLAIVHPEKKEWSVVRMKRRAKEADALKQRVAAREEQWSALETLTLKEQSESKAIIEQYTQENKKEEATVMRTELSTAVRSAIVLDEDPPKDTPKGRVFKILRDIQAEDSSSSKDRGNNGVPASGKASSKKGGPVRSILNEVIKPVTTILASSSSKKRTSSSDCSVSEEASCDEMKTTSATTSAKGETSSATQTSAAVEQSSVVQSETQSSDAPLSLPVPVPVPTVPPVQTPAIKL